MPSVLGRNSVTRSTQDLGVPLHQLTRILRLLLQRAARFPDGCRVHSLLGGTDHIDHHQQCRKYVKRRRGQDSNLRPPGIRAGRSSAELPRRHCDHFLGHRVGQLICRGGRVGIAVDHVHS